MDPLLDPLKRHLDLDVALKSLPTRTDLVSRLLESYGVHGDRNAWSCPLALYLRGRLMPSLPGLTLLVSSHTASLSMPDGTRVKMALPGHLQAFVDDFDHGRLPQLVGRS